MIVWIKSRLSLKLDHIGSKTRSLGQTIGTPCEHSRGQIFSPILMKFDQNEFLDIILDEFEIGTHGVKN